MLAALLAACAAPSEVTPRASEPAGVESAPTPDYAAVDGILVGVAQADRPEILRLVDGLIREALAGADPKLDDRAKLLLLNWYVHSHFENVSLTPFTILEALRERKAVCGGSSIALQLMARRLGYETRTAGLFAIQPQASHVVAEVKYDGRWHFFDPTFGAFVTADGTLSGELVSFDTMIKYRRVMAGNVYYAVSEGRLGKDHPPRVGDTPDGLYSRVQTVLLEGGGYADFLGTFQGATVYAAESGKTLTIRHEADFNAHETLQLGEIDGSYQDIAVHRDDSGNYDGAGLQFLGDLSGTHGALWGRHAYRFRGLAPGDAVSLHADIVDGDGAFVRAAVRKADVVNEWRTATTYDLVLRAVRDDVEVTLEAEPQRRILFDRLRFEGR